jgi:hypothetical protein
LDLEAIVKEIAAICKRYRLSSVYGDRYAAQWVRKSFALRASATKSPRPKLPTDPEATRTSIRT